MLHANGRLHPRLLLEVATRNGPHCIAESPVEVFLVGLVDAVPAAAQQVGHTANVGALTGEDELGGRALDVWQLPMHGLGLLDRLPEDAADVAEKPDRGAEDFDGGTVSRRSAGVPDAVRAPAGVLRLCASRPEQSRDRLAVGACVAASTALLQPVVESLQEPICPIRLLEKLATVYEPMIASATSG